MAYAHRPRILDADTHMMERPDWIAEFADLSIRDRLMPFGGPNNTDGLRFVEDAIKRFDKRRSDDAIAAKAEADFLSMKQKGWQKHEVGAARSPAPLCFVDEAFLLHFALISG